MVTTPAPDDSQVEAQASEPVSAANGTSEDIDYQAKANEL